MKTSEKSQKATLKVVEAVDRALAKHSADNVDIVRNEETGLVDVIYHSAKNSFAIESGVANMDHVDKVALIPELNKRGVGYCW